MTFSTEVAFGERENIINSVILNNYLATEYEMEIIEFTEDTHTELLHAQYHKKRH